DGGDDGDWQRSEGHGLALRAAVHDGRGARERVQRGRRSAPRERADRDWARPVHDHADRQPVIAPAHLEHGAGRPGACRHDTRAGGGGRMSRSTGRKMLSSAFVGFCALSVLLALVPLALVLFYVVSQGLQALNVAFFTQMPKPVGEPGGGMANAIVGTLMLAGLGSLLAVPIGILSGVYMAEFSGTRLAS